MSHRTLSSFCRCVLWHLAAWGGFVCAAAAGVDLPRATDSTVVFDLPVELAERSLKRFSEQSGREVLFASEVTRGIRTNSVRGEMRPADALNQLLANTGLVAVDDGDGGAYSVRKEMPDEAKNGSWAAPTQGRRPRRLNPTFHPINPTRV